MSETHTNLPSIEKLKMECEKYGLEGLINHYYRYDILIGNEESIMFLEEKYEEYVKNRRDA